MNQPNNGGPAFPLKEAHTGDALGMSLRDYFAAQAVTAIISMNYPMSDIGYSMKNGKSIMENYAACAYVMADAMLAARGAA